MSYQLKTMFKICARIICEESSMVALSDLDTHFLYIKLTLFCFFFFRKNLENKGDLLRRKLCDDDPLF